MVSAVGGRLAAAVTHAGGLGLVGSGYANADTIPRSCQRMAIRALPYAEVPHGAETVLLVEDDDGVCEYVANALSRLGYLVLKAAEGRQALELLKASGHRPA